MGCGSSSADTKDNKAKVGNIQNNPEVVITEKEEIKFPPGFDKICEEELKIHNYLRSLHDAPPLKINKDLNTMAQIHANFSASKGALEPSKERKLKGHETENIGENLYFGNLSGMQKYVNGEISNEFYNEIINYDFSLGEQNYGNFREFTQLIWKSTKEVGFGISFKDGNIYFVANYYPCGNLNGKFSTEVNNLKEEVSFPSPKDNFDANIDTVRQVELTTINALREKHSVDPLEIDDELNQAAMEHAQTIALTENFTFYQKDCEMIYWTNYGKLTINMNEKNIGGHFSKFWMDQLGDFDFDKFERKKDSDEILVNMALALIWKSFTKVGFGYYFIDETHVYGVALFDGLVAENNYFQNVCKAK